MKLSHAVIAIAALSQSSAIFAKSAINCQYKHTGTIHRIVGESYNAQFTYEQNFYLALDKHISQADALALARCIIKHSKSAKEIRKTFGNIQFSKTAYIFPANDYSYGVVGYSPNISSPTEDFENWRSSGSIVKLTYKIKLDGTTTEFDSIAATFFNGQPTSWLRFDGRIFRRQDTQCLECHKKQQNNAFLFLEHNFQRLPAL